MTLANFTEQATCPLEAAHWWK